MQLTVCCRSRYDVNQSDIRYSEVKQSVSRDNTIKEYVKPPEPEYEAIETDRKPTGDVKMDVNPAYHSCDVKMDANPAYHATSQSCKKSH